MNKLVEFEILNCNDRSELMAILATAGYPVVMETRDDKDWSHVKHYIVVVYVKTEAHK